METRGDPFPKLVVAEEARPHFGSQSVLFPDFAYNERASNSETIPLSFYYFFVW